MKNDECKMCNICANNSCIDNYQKGIQTCCPAKKYSKIIEDTKSEYMKPEVIEIYKASSKVTTDGYEKWTRIQECIEFTKYLGIKKIGLASCIALIDELKMMSKLFDKLDIEIVATACKIGAITAEARGIPEIDGLKGTTCNPIAQAKIMNSQNTQLNFTLGLCIGHDILFSMYSKAPVSTVIVKDRVTGNNPAVALYAGHLRRSLRKKYC
jgi:uncharacterized metal-binding protein